MITYGSGILNNLINKLLIEAHIPGYNYCGPGTKLRKRLARGDEEINLLDSACKEHDIAYSQNRESTEYQNAADKILAEKAWQRVLAKDSTLREKSAAYVVANIMKVKSKFGMGMKIRKRKSKKRKTKKRKMINFKTIISAARKSLDKKTKKSRIAIKSALSGARRVVKKRGGKKNLLNSISIRIV